MTTNQKKIKSLCRRFFNQLQAVFNEMEEEEYECHGSSTAVMAQGYAEEVAESTPEDWK